VELADKTAAPYAQALFSQRWSDLAERRHRTAGVRVADRHAERVGGIGAWDPVSASKRTTICCICSFVARP